MEFNGLCEKLRHVSSGMPRAKYYILPFSFFLEISTSASFYSIFPFPPQRLKPFSDYLIFESTGLCGATEYLASSPIR